MNVAQVSVVIPARDAAGTLPDTLEGLRAQKFRGGFEVILVDDGSSDATGQIAEESGVVTRILRLDGVGPAGARNAGAAAASAAQLAFLDADCRPTANWLTAGCQALQSAELVIGETRPRADQPLGPFDRTLSVRPGSPLFEAANLFVRRGLFEQIGGFESWLVPQRGKELGEDVWFGWRARRSGARIASCPGALVDHANHPRGPLGFACERWRLRFFPALARRVPELRAELFYGRIFLTPRSACFDAALLGVGLARASGRPAFAAAAVPYARVLSHDLREPDGLRKALGRLSADAVGLSALLFGSAHYRSVLL